MNRLQLAQRIRKECGISGTGPTTTISQSGEMESVVNWCDDAYEDIQSKYKNWNFLRTEFSISVTATTTEAGATYTPAAVSLPLLNDWRNDSLRCYLTSAGVRDEQWLTYVPWDEFRDAMAFGANRLNVSRPTWFTIKPDKSIRFWPLPNDTYTIVGDYFKMPNVMTADASVPLWPCREADKAIVWQALMLYGGFESASTVYAYAQHEYNRLMRVLEADQLPPIEVELSLI